MTTGSGGWPCVLVHFLRSMTPHLSFENDASPNGDSCAFFGGGLECFYLSPAQQLALKPKPESEMANALSYLRRHRGQAGLITFELIFNDPNDGSNEQVKLMERREDRILAWLHRVAPRATLVLIYSPYTKEMRPPTDVFRTFFPREAAKYSGLSVDLYPSFANHPAFLDGGGHPTDAGQRTIARLIWQAYKRSIGTP
jgi:hypothetical protein